MQTLSSQGKPKRKQRATFHLVTQEPNPPQADPPSPLPSSITSLISARASLMSATTPNTQRSSGPHPVSDRQKALPLPLPPAYEASSINSPSRKPPPHESTIIANSHLRSAPSSEQTPFIAKSPLRSAPSFESAMTPSTPVRTAPTGYESSLTAKSPLRNASSYHEPLISANSPLRMLPSYQRRIISPSASPMKQTHNGTGELVESRQHTVGTFESRPNTLGGTESRHNKDAEPRISALGGLESIRSKNGTFSSMDLMRNRNTATTGAGSSQPGSARKKEAVPASPAAKREKENMRSTLREQGRR